MSSRRALGKSRPRLGVLQVALQTGVAALEGRLREADSLQGRLDAKRQLVRQTDTELQALRGEIAAELERLDEVRQARIVTEARTAERRTKLEALEKNLGETESQQTDAAAQLGRIQAEADTLQERKDALLIEIRDLAAKQAAGQQALEEARVARASLEGESAQRSTELLSLRRRIEEEENRIKDLQTQVAAIRADLSVLEELRNDIEAKRVAAREDLNRAERDIAATRAEAAEEHAAVERLERRNTELQILITALEARQNILQETLKEMERTATESRELLRMLDQQIREKREALDSIEDQRTAVNGERPATETKPSLSPDDDGADGSAAGRPPTSVGSSD